MKNADSILHVRVPGCVKKRSARLAKKLGFKSHSAMIVDMMRGKIEQQNPINK